jgi:sphingomyelin synthase-related protein 1
MSRHLGPEFAKLAVSYVYMFVVFMLTAFVMVVVHDRVPDMDRYPPLPDIVLDNLPYIPWAFELCELTAVSMSLALVVILIIHKHRFVNSFTLIV